MNVRSPAVKANQRHGVQFVQRNTPAQIFHCLKVTNKLVDCQSHFIRHHLGLRSDCEAGQSKETYRFSFLTFQNWIKFRIFYNKLISAISLKWKRTIKTNDYDFFKITQNERININLCSDFCILLKSWSRLNLALFTLPECSLSLSKIRYYLFLGGRVGEGCLWPWTNTEVRQQSFRKWWVLINHLLLTCPKPHSSFSVAQPAPTGGRKMAQEERSKKAPHDSGELRGHWLLAGPYFSHHKNSNLPAIMEVLFTNHHHPRLSIHSYKTPGLFKLIYTDHPSFTWCPWRCSLLTSNPPKKNPNNNKKLSALFWINAEFW